MLVFCYTKSVMSSYKELIKELTHKGVLKTPRTIRAFEAVDRKNFVPPEREGEAYKNRPLPIGEGQTISQPLTVAFMVELLDPQEGETVLEIGSGSGWQTAILAKLVGESGHVVAIERLPALCKMTKQNIQKYGYPHITPLCQDGTKGYEKKAPYDKIIAGAAGKELPAAWKEQVKVGGVIVVPLGASVYKITKTDKETLERDEHPGFMFVPLIEE